MPSNFNCAAVVYSRITEVPGANPGLGLDVSSRHGYGELGLGLKENRYAGTPKTQSGNRPAVEARRIMNGVDIIVNKMVRMTTLNRICLKLYRIAQFHVLSLTDYFELTSCCLDGAFM